MPKPTTPQTGDQRERWGHVEEFVEGTEFHPEPYWKRLGGDIPTIGSRRVEIDFQNFSAFDPIAFDLSSNERVVGVTQRGGYRQVWIEREVRGDG